MCRSSQLCRHALSAYRSSASATSFWLDVAMMSLSCFASAVMRLWCVVQWRRVDACVTDGHCSAPLDVNDISSVALCRDGRVLSKPDHHRFVRIVDAMSGVALSDRRYHSLYVDTSGALLWRDEAKAVVVSSGPNSAGRVLADVVGHAFTSFRYGVAINSTEHRVLRFDIDPEPTAEPDRNVSVAALATLLHC